VAGRLRETLSPISVAGYVRGLKAFADWCAAEQVADPGALRALRQPKVPHKLVEPLSDEAMRLLLDGASVCVTGRSCCSSSTPGCAYRNWLGCGRAICAPTAARK
jgi:site-specific recombinase XerD